MIIESTIWWAKVLKAVPNYNKDGEEFTVDVTVTPAIREQLREAGIEHKIQPAVNSRGRAHVSEGEYINITIPTMGGKTALRPPQVKDRFGNDWPKDALIGNGSTAEIMFEVRSGVLRNGDAWAKPSLRAVKILDHVPVEPKEDFTYDVAPADVTQEAWD